jgi:predicted GH43/DUF377 family glycosyl hydrolase
MVRFEGNPILEPIEAHVWESKHVFNTAMIQLEGRIHYFYRAMGQDIVSRLGYASSEDGYHIDERLPYPVFEPSTSLEKYGCEDPRITVLNGRCYMTYTAYGDIYQIGITSISPEDLMGKRWEWGERFYPFPNIKNKNAVIFPRMVNGLYTMCHRLDPDVYVAFSKDLRSWGESEWVMGPRQGHWDCVKVGAAGPPIEIEEGWLLVYHGVDSDKIYRLGSAILDRDNPQKVVYRSEEPILEPCEDYERNGWIPNVVFSCGSVLVDDKLLISYGGADNVIGVATFDLKEILR